MKISQIIIEDYVQYKFPSLFIGTTKCNRHCKNCQNESLRTHSLDIPNERLIDKYVSNPLTSAVTFGGLDPMDTYEELLQFYIDFRKVSSDTVVIYTGYDYEEIKDKIDNLLAYGRNLVIKVGHYIDGQASHWDDILGVMLASDNQYAIEFI